MPSTKSAICLEKVGTALAGNSNISLIIPDTTPSLSLRTSFILCKNDCSSKMLPALSKEPTIPSNNALESPLLELTALAVIDSGAAKG